MLIDIKKYKKNQSLVKFMVLLVIMLFISLSGLLFFFIVEKIASLFDLIIQFVPFLKDAGASLYLAVIIPAWVLGYLYAYFCTKIIGNNLNDYSKDRFILEIIFFIWIIVSMMSIFRVRFY